MFGMERHDRDARFCVSAESSVLAGKSIFQVALVKAVFRASVQELAEQLFRYMTEILGRLILECDSHFVGLFVVADDINRAGFDGLHLHGDLPEDASKLCG